MAGVETLKSGPLLLWGQGFGRPGENDRHLFACNAINNSLRFVFEDDCELLVWNPAHIKIDDKEFCIVSASALRYTWYYASRPHTAAKLYYKDFATQDGGVLSRTNWDQIPGSGWLADDAAMLPAVVML